MSGSQLTYMPHDRTPLNSRPATEAQCEAATRLVLRHAHDQADAALLLEALGLDTAPAGQVPEPAPPDLPWTRVAAWTTTHLLRDGWTLCGRSVSPDVVMPDDGRKRCGVCDRMTSKEAA